MAHSIRRVYTRWQSRSTADPRLARVLRGSASILAGRGLTLLVNIVTLPLTLHYLGSVEYGAWVTISSTVVLFAILDLGLANTLTTAVAEALAENSDAKAREYFATAFWMTTACVLLLSPALYFLWTHLHWGALFRLTDPAHIAHARACAGIAGLFFMVSLPLALAPRVLAGYQQVHLANYFTMGGSVLSFISILVTVRLHGSMTMLMLGYCASLAVAALGLNLWLCFWYRPFLRPGLAHVRPSVLRTLLGQGSLFFLLQLASLVVFNSDNLVITHFLGTASVTPYSTAWKLTQYAAALQGLLIPTLWPAFTEAYRKGQLEWVQTTYRNIQRKTLTFVGATAVLIGLFGRFAIRFWAGPEALPSTQLLWLMAIFAFVMSATSTQALLLTATGRLRLEVSVALLAAALNLGLSILLVQRLGMDGVVLGSIVSFLLVMFGPQELEVRRVLAGKFLRSR